MSDLQAAVADLVAQGHSNPEIAAELGLNERTVRRHKAKARERGLIDPAVREAMGKAGTDLVPHSMWLKTDDQSVYIHLGKRGQGQQIAEAIREALEDVPSVKPKPAPAHVYSDLAHVLPIADHHIGMHSWRRETGTDYDLRLAEDVLLEASADLIGRAEPAAECVVLNLGDIYHADDSRNVTPRSLHHLDVDGRFSKVIAAGVHMVAAVIDLALTRFSAVRYRGVPGNHDPHSGPWLSVALAQRYRNEPRVIIDDAPGAWWAWEWGLCSVFATHGDKVKFDRMAMFIADEWPEIWGRTRFRWGLTGHIHHDRLRDCGGVQIESLRTLAPRDMHGHSLGYSSRQTLQLRTLDKEHGEVERRMKTFLRERYRSAA